MSKAASGSSGPTSGTGGSATQQANDMTRNFILGVPKEGLSPNSEEAAELQAAEAFVSDIQQEILAYDIANAQAMETYARKAWSYVPFLGRRARESLEEEARMKREEQIAPEAAETLHTERVVDSMNTAGGLAGLDAAKAAEAAAAAGGAFLHKQKVGTTRGGFQVERTSALDQDVLRELAKSGSKGSHSHMGGGGGAAAAAAAASKPKTMNTWLFKKKHPGWTPLMQRWWVPWLCLGALVLVWTPDVWKLRTLYYLDWQYTVLRQNIHKSYWRLTMSKEDYEALMADIEAQRPSKVKGTDCPF